MKRKSWKWAILAVLIVLEAACSDEGPRVADITPSRTVSEEGIPKADLGSPIAFAAASSERLVLGEQSQIRVYEAPFLTVSHTLGGVGRGPGEFQRILRVAMARDGRMAVADLGNRKVVLYKNDSTWLRDLQFTDGPVGEVGYDGTGRLMLQRRATQPFSGSNAGAGMVWVYSNDTTEIYRIGTQRWSNDPPESAVLNEIRLSPTASGGALIVYTYQGYVEKYDSKGNLLTRFALQLVAKDTVGPIVKRNPEQPGRIAFARRQLAYGIVELHDGTIAVLRAVQAADQNSSSSHIQVYSVKGELLAVLRLGELVQGIALSGNEVVTLAFNDPGPRLSFYAQPLGER